MNASEIIKSIENEQLKAEVPEFSVGDTVKVYGKIKEGNRERIQVFEGTVIKKQNGSNRTTFTVRKLSNERCSKQINLTVVFAVQVELLSCQVGPTNAKVAKHQSPYPPSHIKLLNSKVHPIKGQQESQR